MIRVGDWMTTYTGRQFWPLSAHPDDVCLEDIAHALSNQCRFAGHCRIFYSVAEHSVRVAKLVMERQANWDTRKRLNLGRAALIHDATEAYLMDIPKPLKRQSAFDEYRDIEHALEKVIDEAFMVTRYDGETDHIIKLADQALLMTELRDLMPPPPAPFDPLGAHVAPGTEALKEPIEPFPRRLVEQIFMGTAHELGLE